MAEDKRVTENTCVCVGGPLDGQRYECDAPSFSAPEYPRDLDFSIGRSSDSEFRAFVREHHYVKDRFWTAENDGSGQFEFTYWKHSDMPRAEVIRRLFSAYSFSVLEADALQHEGVFPPSS